MICQPWFASPSPSVVAYTASCASSYPQYPRPALQSIHENSQAVFMIVRGGAVSGRRSGALQKKKAGCPISAAAETEPRTQPQSASYAWRSEPGASVAGEEGQFLSSSSPAPPQRAPHQSSDASLQSARQQWQANAAGQISREAAQTGQQQLHNAPITAHAAPSRQVAPSMSEVFLCSYCTLSSSICGTPNVLLSAHNCIGVSY